MKIYDALGLEGTLPGVISFVGGGGKTTAIFRLSSELKLKGKQVLVTTTTAIFKPDHDRYDNLYVINKSRHTIVKPPSGTGGSITVLASGYRNGKEKLAGLPPEEVDEFAEKGDFGAILVEADGSRMLPVKAPADHEPVIPWSTDICVAVTGFDCFGKPADDTTVHRLEAFLAITGATPMTPINRTMLSALVSSPRGMFKGSPPKAKRIWIINKVDTEAQLDHAAELAAYVLKESTVPDMVLCASVRSGEPVKKKYINNRST